MPKPEKMNKVTGIAPHDKSKSHLSDTIRAGVQAHRDSSRIDGIPFAEAARQFLAEEVSAGIEEEKMALRKKHALHNQKIRGRLEGRELPPTNLMTLLSWSILQTVHAKTSEMRDEIQRRVQGRRQAQREARAKVESRISR